MNKILLVFLFAFLAGSLQAQKVALVLSGGGAKGLAHVGVIKALEENEIPIDYVAGTSMGGIIAGCYAAGMSPDQIEAMVLSPEFQNWVNGKLEDGYNYHYAAKGEDPSFLNLRLTLDSSLNATINSSLASDLSLNFALVERLAQPSANAGYNFDSLFVPLRVMASDIFTQQEVIMREGTLSEALRATLTVPFFYKPIRIKDKYLFDGGIYNNFPVDVAREEFDPDVVIGVNVSSKVFKKYPYEEDDELINSSLLFMLLDKAKVENLSKKDIYIEPNLENYNALDFDKANAMVDSGYAVARKMMDSIKSKIPARRVCEDITEKRNAFNDRNLPLRFKNIKFYGFGRHQENYIRKIISKKKQEIYLEDLKAGYFKLVSEEFFGSIYPNVVFDSATQAYTLELYNRPQNDLDLNFGGVIATRDISNIFLGFDFYFFNRFLLNPAFNFYAGDFYKSAQLKARFNFPAFRAFYIEPGATYNSKNFLNGDDILVRDESPTFLRQEDRRYGINMGFPIGSKLTGIIYGSYIETRDEFANTTTLQSDDILDEMKLDGIRAGLRFSRNSLNRRMYANEGKSFQLSFDYFDLTERYTPGSTSLITSPQTRDHKWFRGKVSIEQYFKTGRYSVGYAAEGLFSNQPFFSNYTATIARTAAFNPLQDTRTLFIQRLRGHNYVAGGMRNVFSIFSKLDFRLEGYVFKALEEIQETQDQQPQYNDLFDDILIAGTAGMVLHTPVGPISLSVNYYDDRENQFGVLLHVGYLLFNKGAME